MFLDSDFNYLRVRTEILLNENTTKIATNGSIGVRGEGGGQLPPKIRAISPKIRAISLKIRAFCVWLETGGSIYIEN